jgi:hypothetical protein
MPYDPPTSADVAAEMPTRTIGSATNLDPDSSEAEDFSADTRPTKAQVERAIGEAVALLLPRLGTVPARLEPFAQRVTVLRTAKLLERRYWPEEVDDDRGPYNALTEELDEALKAYDAALAGDEPGSTHRTASLRVGTLLSQAQPWLLSE